MLSALSLLRQKPSSDRKMHNLIPYGLCMSSDRQGAALQTAGPVRYLQMEAISKERWGRCKQPTARWANALLLSLPRKWELRQRSQKLDFEELWVRNQIGQNQSFCQHAPIWFGQKTHKYWLHTQNKKNHTESLKKKRKKKKPAKTQAAECVSLNGNWRTCLSQKWVCLMWLPYCSTRKTVNLWLSDIPMNITVAGRKTWPMQWALGSLPSSSSEDHPRLRS